MTCSEARAIRVEMPEVRGERVVFRWSEPDASPWQKRNTFSVVYPGVDLEVFSKELLVEIFISLQWRVFALFQTAVEVELPVTMPEATVHWWQGFHEAWHVRATPLRDTRYSAWAKQPVVRDERAVGVFFGGGKDSTLARSVLAEVYGEEQVLLIQVIHPFWFDAKERNRLRARQRKLMIEPAIDGTRLSAAMIETDYMANFTVEGRAGKPHTNVYTVLSLPVLLYRGVREAFMSNERSAYWYRTGADGQVTLGYPSSRPEVYAGQAAHLESVSDITIKWGNTHFPISEFLSYKILLERYPESFRKIVMCVLADVEHRWCMGCKKCAQYVHFGLLCGQRFEDVDYEYFWLHSKYIQGLLSAAASGKPRNPETHNLPWQSSVSHGYHFGSFSHTMRMLKRDSVRGLVPRSNHEVLDVLADAWGNREFGAVEVVSADAIELANTPGARAVALLYSEHAPVESGVFRQQPYMNALVDYDFTRRSDKWGRMPPLSEA